MKQITEDYVSYEIAQLLKEKGFDIPCRQAYFNGSLVDYTMYGFCDGELIDCPSQSLALKWLREVHKIHIVIYPYGEYSCDNYQFDVYKNNKLVISKDDGYITYEETCEAALLYVLKNLI